jgi:Fe/S biogenesis protein NfuA
MTDQEVPNVSVSLSAQVYLSGLLERQEVTGMAVRMFVTQPGTRYAETCLAYCRPGEEHEDDYRLELEQLLVFLERNSLPYLDEAEVDFQEDKMGGQLTIKAPNSKMPRVSEDSPLSERIQYLLATEVNPSLAAHGGEVSLVEVTSEQVAILRFGGGCQGCSAVDITLKQGVERTLMDQLPELKGIQDVTDHSKTENAYM